MKDILIAWAISAAVLLLLVGVLGRTMTPPRGVLGALIDGRGRFSLTHFQIVVWSIVILSLISGIFWGSLLDGAKDPLDFPIPDEVLGLLGISAGSAVTAGVVKASKDATADTRERIAASSPEDPPRLAQMFWLEEGEYADRVVDVTKFQNFVITITLVVAYVALAIDQIQDLSTVEDATLPTFSGAFLILLGISHGAYIAAKVPTQAGQAPGLNMDNRRGVAEEVAATGTPPAEFAPRNQP